MADPGVSAGSGSEWVSDDASSEPAVERVSAEPDEFPPRWASAWGEDRYGRYAEILVRDIPQRFRWIVPGMFWMGSLEGEAGREQNEVRHRVTLTRGFWLGDTTVTQALYEAVLGSNPSRFEGDAGLPVEQVSWNDAMAFCAALNALISELDAGLPSEAQWEYACRAGSETPFSSGETITPEQVNYDGNYPYGRARKGLYRERTVTVGCLPPNAWGLHEMHGNVWEWCSDWYDVGASGNARDPEGPALGSSRVLRGGSWISNAVNARSARRNALDPGPRDGRIGFRLAPGRWAAGPEERGRRTAPEREPSRATREGAREGVAAGASGIDLQRSEVFEQAEEWLRELAMRLRAGGTERGDKTGERGDVHAAEIFVEQILSWFGASLVAPLLADLDLTPKRLARGLDALAGHLDGLQGSELARQVLRWQPVVSAILRGDRSTDILKKLASAGIAELIRGRSTKPRPASPKSHTITRSRDSDEEE